MSIFDHPDAVPTVPTWRCPHCRTLQPEASRCRACARAAVTCVTCHLYRRSVASGLGYCATDRARSPLVGDEVCACWEAAPGFDVARGLFSDLEVVAAQPHADSVPQAGAVAPHELPLPAWTPSPPRGRLVDAPHVAPGRQVMSEVQRRSRRSRAG